MNSDVKIPGKACLLSECM